MAVNQLLTPLKSTSNWLQTMHNDYVHKDVLNPCFYRILNGISHEIYATDVIDSYQRGDH